MSDDESDDSIPIGGLYTVRVVVEGIKQAMVTKLTDHDGLLRATIEKELTAAVERFNPEAQLPRMAEELVQQYVPTLLKSSLEYAIHDAFRTIDAHTMLYGLVKRALGGLLKDPEVQQKPKDLFTFLCAKLATGKPVVVGLRTGAKSKPEGIRAEVLLGISKSCDSDKIFLNIWEDVEDIDRLITVDGVPIAELLK